MPEQVCFGGVDNTSLCLEMGNRNAYYYSLIPTGILKKKILKTSRSLLREKKHSEACDNLNMLCERGK